MSPHTATFKLIIIYPHIYYTTDKHIASQYQVYLQAPAKSISSNYFILD